MTSKHRSKHHWRRSHYIRARTPWRTRLVFWKRFFYSWCEFSYSWLFPSNQTDKSCFYAVALLARNPVRTVYIYKYIYSYGCYRCWYHGVCSCWRMLPFTCIHRWIIWFLSSTKLREIKFQRVWSGMLSLACGWANYLQPAQNITLSSRLFVWWSLLR